jgi:hypothetical protein
MKYLSLLAIVFSLALLPASPAFAQAHTFSGIVNHVSDNSIKITDNKTHQTLSFLIVPKFDQVFSSDGKTTYQMKAVKAGQYVKVYYDQKLLGQRHADRIILLNQNNSIKGQQ